MKETKKGRQCLLSFGLEIFVLGFRLVRVDVVVVWECVVFLL